MKNMFAQRISRLRRLNGWTQKAAAEKLGISPALLSHYENGIRECSLDFVITAAQVFGVSTDYLLGLTEKSEYVVETAINDDLSGALEQYPKLQFGKTQVVNSINILYSITAKIGMPSLHSDLNSILCAYIYYVLRVYQTALGQNDKELFELPIEDGMIFCRSFEAVISSHILKTVEKNQNYITIDKSYIKKEYPNSAQFLFNLIESVERQTQI